MKHAILLVVRFLGSFVVMLIAFIASQSIIGIGSLPVSPEETSESMQALLMVSLLNSLVLSYLILQSRCYGVTLVATVFLVHFGVETFMTQIETLFFNASIQMTPDVLTRVIALGFLRALIFAPLAVLVWGKLRGAPGQEQPHSVSLPAAEWVKRLALLAVVYVVVYFVFGYFVPWQSPTVREYYTGTTDILPFHIHLLNSVTGAPALPLFQILRGVLWAGLALLIVWMTESRSWQIGVVIALSFAVLLASGLIFPNPYMPAQVRQAHFLELASSMFAYGIIAGWVWTRPVGTRPVLQHQVT